MHRLQKLPNIVVIFFYTPYLCVCKKYEALLANGLIYGKLLHLMDRLPVNGGNIPIF